MSEETVLVHVVRAVRELRAAENEVGCLWCRSHVHEVRMIVEDVADIARLAVELRDPAARDLFRKVGTAADRLCVLALLGKIFHRVRGFARSY
jgi:hypothetical protein